MLLQAGPSSVVVQVVYRTLIPSLGEDQSPTYTFIVKHFCIFLVTLVAKLRDCYIIIVILQLITVKVSHSNKISVL